MKSTNVVFILTLAFTAPMLSITSSHRSPMATESAAIQAEDKHVLRDGDLIFQSSSSGQGKAIQLATRSKYSHMGMIQKIGHQYYVYEAVQPVKLTPFDSWVRRGENSHYVVKRLKDSETLLTPENVKKMNAYGQKFKGKDYDIYFDWSDEKIYCSELVWKIYKEALNIEIGKLQKLREFDLSSAIVKQKLKERYGEHIPLDEQVISPSAMFNSDKLITVVSYEKPKGEKI